MNPYKWNRKSEKSMSKRHGMKKILLAINGFQDGKGPQAKKCRHSRS